MKQHYVNKLVLLLSFIFTSHLFSQTQLDGNVWTVVPFTTDNNGTNRITATDINEALTTGKKVTFAANKTYTITEGTIEIHTGQSLHIPTSVILRFPATTETAIKLHGARFNGTSNKSGSMLSGRGSIIGSSTNTQSGSMDIISNCSGGTNVAVLVMGANSKVELGRILNFGVGVKLLGDSNHANQNGYSGGAQYNNIYVGHILYCIKGVELNSINNGWTNQNYIHIDEIKGGSNPNCTDWGIYIDSNTAFRPNQNFFSGSIEGIMNKGSIYIGGGVNNVFTGLRFETPGNTNYFQLESSKNKGEPVNNFVYGAGASHIGWGHVTGTAKKRDALLFYGSKNSDFFIENNLITSVLPNRRVAIGTEFASAKLEVNKLKESNQSPIARFGYDRDSLATRLEIKIDPHSTENTVSDLELVATYSSGGADFHIGTALKNRVMTFKNNSNARVGINTELPNYELDVNGTINALSYLVDGVSLSPRPASNNSTQFTEGNTASINDKSDNEGINITRLYNMTKMITDAVPNKDTENENAEESKNVRYLFSMDELEQNFPELVYTNEETQRKSVDYISFIPLMVKKLKEQEEKILQLEAILIGEEANTDIFDSENDGGRNSGAKLYQNVPNPNSSNAEIKVFLPENVKTAKLIIFDLQGKKLKEITIEKRANQTINILANEFASGMYLYSLVADGFLIDTKRMLIDN